MFLWGSFSLPWLLQWPWKWHKKKRENRGRIKRFINNKQAFRLGQKCIIFACFCPNFKKTSPYFAVLRLCWPLRLHTTLFSHQCELAPVKFLNKENIAQVSTILSVLIIMNVRFELWWFFLDVCKLPKHWYFNYSCIQEVELMQFENRCNAGSGQYFCWKFERAYGHWTITKNLILWPPIFSIAV